MRGSECSMQYTTAATNERCSSSGERLQERGGVKRGRESPGERRVQARVCSAVQNQRVCNAKERDPERGVFKKER